MTLANILKTRWLTILVVLAIVGILATVILRLITPATTQIPKTDFVSTNQSGSLTSFSGVKFTGNYSSDIASLPPAVMQPSQTTLDYIKNQLIEKNDLQQAVGIESLWRGNNYTLSYNSANDTYLFYSNFEPTEGKLIDDTNKNLETAKEFVRETFPNLNLVAQTDSILYLSGYGEYEESNKDNANSMEIPFTYTINGVPVYFNHEAMPPVLVIMNNEGTIQKVRFQTFFLEFIPGETKMPLINIGDALDNINNDQASIIRAYNDDGEFSLGTIKSGNLKKVQLEYRADLDSGLVYPFYHFTGEITDTSGKLINTEIITPAVKLREQ